VSAAVFFACLGAARTRAAALCLFASLLFAGAALAAANPACPDYPPPAQVPPSTPLCVGGFCGEGCGPVCAQYAAARDCPPWGPCVGTLHASLSSLWTHLECWAQYNTPKGPSSANGVAACDIRYLCPAGYSLSSISVCTAGGTPPCPKATPKDNGEPPHCPSLARGNPVNAGTGLKYQAEPVYVGAGPYPLAYGLAYNSQRADDPYGAWSGAHGSHWIGRYERRLVPSLGASASASPVVTVQRPDGRAYEFRKQAASATAYASDADVNGRLARLALRRSPPGRDRAVRPRGQAALRRQPGRAGPHAVLR
jgi:hypothetical protein